MSTEETNHSQYMQAVENTSPYEPIATATTPNLSFRKRVSRVLLNPIKVGVDKKATHLWNK